MAPVTDQQQQFSDFILNRIKDGEEKPAKALLAEAFANLQNNAVGTEYLKSFRYRLSGMLKPESLDEVRTAIAKFSATVK
jgi:hypothetical protein